MYLPPPIKKWLLLGGAEIWSPVTLTSPRVTYLPSELDPPPQEQQQREVDSSPSALSRHQSTTPCKRQQPIGLSISPRQLSLFQWWISYNFKISWRTLTPGSSHKLTRITHFLAIIVFSNTIWLTQESIKKKKKKDDPKRQLSTTILKVFFLSLFLNRQAIKATRCHYDNKVY